MFIEHEIEVEYMVDYVKFYTIECYMDILDLVKEDITSEMSDIRACVFILSKGFKEDKLSKENKTDILDFLCSLKSLVVLVVDTQLSEESLDYLISYDLCFATKNAEINIEIIDKIEYFPLENIQFLLTEKCMKNPELNKYLLQETLINAWIGDEDIRAEVVELLKPILQKKEASYIQFVKGYFNLFKQREKIKLEELQREEINTFCELAISDR